MRKRKEKKRVSKDEEKYCERFPVKRRKIHGNCRKSVRNKQKLKNLNKTEKHRKTKEKTVQKIIHRRRRLFGFFTDKIISSYVVL